MATADTAKMRALGLVLESKRSEARGTGQPIRNAERRVIGASHVVDGVEMITLAGGAE